MRRCVEAKAKKESLVPPGASMHSHFIVFSKTSHLFGIVDNMTCLDTGTTSTATSDSRKDKWNHDRSSSFASCILNVDRASRISRRYVNRIYANIHSFILRPYAVLQCVELFVPVLNMFK